MNKPSGGRRNVALGFAIVIGLLIGIFIKRVGIGLMIGVVLGLVISGLSNRRD